MNVIIMMITILIIKIYILVTRLAENDQLENNYDKNIIILKYQQIFNNRDIIVEVTKNPDEKLQMENICMQDIPLIYTIE